MADNQNSGNPQLPIELWNKIYRYLPLADLFNCRLVCKSWNAYTSSVEVYKSLAIFIPDPNPNPTTLILVTEEKLGQTRATYHRLSLTDIFEKLSKSQQYAHHHPQVWIYGTRLTLQNPGVKTLFSRFASLVTHLTLCNGAKESGPLSRSNMDDLAAIINCVKDSLKYLHFSIDLINNFIVEDTPFISTMESCYFFMARGLDRLKTLAFTPTPGYDLNFEYPTTQIVQILVEIAPELTQIHDLLFPSFCNPQLGVTEHFDCSFVSGPEVVKSFLHPKYVEEESFQMARALFRCPRLDFLTSLSIHPKLVLSKDRDLALGSYHVFLEDAKDSLEHLEMPFLDLEHMRGLGYPEELEFPKLTNLTRLTFLGNLQIFRRCFAQPLADPAKMFPNLTTVELKSLDADTNTKYEDLAGGSRGQLSEIRQFEGVKCLKLGQGTMKDSDIDLDQVQQTFPNVDQLDCEVYEILPKIHDFWPNLGQVSIFQGPFTSDRGQLFQTFIMETLPTMKDLKTLKLMIDARDFKCSVLMGVEMLWLQPLASLLESGELENLTVYIDCDWRIESKYSEDIRKQLEPLQSLAIFNF